MPEEETKVEGELPAEEATPEHEVEAETPAEAAQEETEA